MDIRCLQSASTIDPFGGFDNVMAEIGDVDSFRTHDRQLGSRSKFFVYTVAVKPSHNHTKTFSYQKMYLYVSLQRGPP